MKKTLFILTIYCLLFTSLSAQSVDLLWQGDGYTPPFYNGRTLWSSQSKITLFAVPQKLGGPANLNYKWSRNGTVLGSLSGVGKNTLSLNDSVLSKSQNIRVEIVFGDNEVLAQTSTVITPVTPSLLVYENNPLYGFLFHKEVSGSYPLHEAEITFDAFPLFFSVQDHSDTSLTYRWRTNTGETETKSSVTYRAPEEASGTSLISITLSNADKILQSANKSFLVQFGEE